MDFRTNIFDVKELRQEMLLMNLNDVVETLRKKGYNPTNQLVGYIISGDDKYITSANGARKKITKYDRSELLMAIINSYLGL
ncbi:MAG: IreB family regulatory phosphoprotein [Firmicutes bacterium]|nr:IreB family regulatory phosphoprotein [Bacillota bacterium]